MNTATRQGAANPDVNPGEVVVTENPRNVAIDAMTARMEQARNTELAEAVASDPGLAATQAAINGEIQEANAAAVADGTLAPTDTDGAASRTPMHAPQAQPAANALPADLVDDPLSEYIVMDNGKPMFTAKVNGEMKLIPLDQARRQIQIGTAAEVRMQQAATLEKNTTHQLNERERAIATREAALAQRANAAPGTTAVPSSGDLSEEDLLDEAREIFSTAFSGTEEDAARKLTKTLMKMRAPVQSAPVDEGVIVRKAANAAVTAIQNVDKKKDVDTGYAQFKVDYPEIMSDPNLYKMADDMTDVIEQENPDWKISQVMDEAGKRTRAWVNQIKGVDPELNPNPTPSEPNTPTLAQHPTQNRQERKAGLVRMPTPAASAVHHPTADVPDEEQTPQEAFAELKAARGQP